MAEEIKKSAPKKRAPAKKKPAPKKEQIIKEEEEKIIEEVVVVKEEPVVEKEAVEEVKAVQEEDLLEEEDDRDLDELFEDDDAVKTHLGEKAVNSEARKKWKRELGTKDYEGVKRREVKIGFATDMQTVPASVVKKYIDTALWSKPPWECTHRFMVVMNGPNVETIRDYVRTRNRLFQPIQVFWQEGARAKVLAYERMLRTMDTDSILIIVKGSEDASLRYLKKLAEIRGITILEHDTREN